MTTFVRETRTGCFRAAHCSPPPSLGVDRRARTIAPTSAPQLVVAAIAPVSPGAHPPVEAIRRLTEGRRCAVGAVTEVTR